MLIVGFFFLSNAQISFYISQYAPWTCSTHLIRYRSDVAGVDSHNASLLIGSNGRKWVFQTFKRGRGSLGYFRTAAKQRKLTNFLRVGHRDVYIKRISALLFFNLEKTAKQQSFQHSEPSAFLHIYTFTCVTTIVWGDANANANTAKRGSV